MSVLKPKRGGATPPLRQRTAIITSSGCDDIGYDDIGCDDIGCDDMEWGACSTRSGLSDLFDCQVTTLRSFRRRTPAMLGGFYGGNSIGIRGAAPLDRLVVVADDLDAPAILPGGANTLTITEPGPVGIFSSGVRSVQELQSLLRSGNTIPPFNLEGSLVDDATLATQTTIAEIQTQLAGTGVGYDIILLAPPTASYDTAVDGVFQIRNATQGTTVFNAGSSGALIQGGVDTLNGGEDLDAFYFYDYIVRLNTSLVDFSSGGVGRLKIADNGVVLPQDRVFFCYGNIYNTTYGAGSPNLNRFVPGFEHALLDGLLSVELRAPFATDSLSSYSLQGNTLASGTSTRFGNLSLYLKGLLVDNGRLALCGGLGVSLPTASDTVITLANGTELMHISSESVHLQPFLGMLYTPNQKCFAQAFMQYDVAANGNPVFVNTGTNMSSAGILTDANHLQFDTAIGYWVYQSNQSQGLTGIIPTAEIHHTVSTGDGDIVASGPFQIGNFNGDRSITTLVAGTTFEFGTRTQVAAGYATTIGDDRDHDGAFQIQMNRLLGE
ncbi:MAG: hypothetical protein R3C05_30810 [Pirellulaceae bacterium]